MDNQSCISCESLITAGGVNICGNRYVDITLIFDVLSTSCDRFSLSPDLCTNFGFDTPDYLMGDNDD